MGGIPSAGGAFGGASVWEDAWTFLRGVLDYGVLGAIRNKLDHQHLNDIMPGNPTAERLAVFIATLVNDALFKMGYDTEGVRVESVLVKETASSWAMVSF